MCRGLPWRLVLAGGDVLELVFGPTGSRRHSGCSAIQAGQAGRLLIIWPQPKTDQKWRLIIWPMARKV